MNWEELRCIATDTDKDGSWLTNVDGEFDMDSELIELIDTGSVTITVAGKQYILSIAVEEVK